MANVLTGDPWIIDATAGSVGSPAYAGDLQVSRIRWVGATTAGHQAILQDKNGVQKWASVASGANYAEADDGFRSNGLIIATLGSGKLYLHFSS